MCKSARTERAPKQSGARVHCWLKAQLRSRREIHSMYAFHGTDLESHNQVDLVAQSSEVVSVLVVADLEVWVFWRELEDICLVVHHGCLCPDLTTDLKQRRDRYVKTRPRIVSVSEALLVKIVVQGHLDGGIEYESELVDVVA